MKKARYHRYLRGKAWKKTRLRCLNRHGHRCVNCGSDEQLHVHHKHYGRVGGERLDDLTVLCSACHQLVHKEGIEGLVLNMDIISLRDGAEKHVKELRPMVGKAFDKSRKAGKAGPTNGLRKYMV